MITILTHKKNQNIIIFVKYILKYIFLFFAQKLYFDYYRFYEIIKYSGHVDVTKSLLIGLNENNIKFNINPKNVNNYYENVIVLSGKKELLNAIEYKRRKSIKNLFAGPNICILPSDIGNIFIKEEVDKIVTPSKWVSNSYVKDLPQLYKKIIEWPAGVDQDFWKPKINQKKNIVLIYLKRPFSVNRIKDYLKILEHLKLSYKIIHYGFYNRIQYLKLLRNAKYTIFFSVSESQGIAMLESWSVGVPTLIFDNNKINYKNNIILCDTSPYLSKNTGLKFKDINDFNGKINFFEENYKKLQTREWVLNNLTNKLSARILINNFI